MAVKKKRSVRHLKLTCANCRGAFTIITSRPAAFTTANPSSLSSLCPTCGEHLFSKGCSRLQMVTLTKPPESKPTEVNAAECLNPRQLENTKAFASYAVEAFYGQAMRGDQAAAEALAEIAIWATTYLTGLGRHRPHLLRPTARHTSGWPVIGSKKVFIQNAVKQMLKNLELGRDCIHGGQWKASSSATKVAISLAVWLKENHEKLCLPDLTRLTLPLWFEIGWRRLLVATDGQPHKDPLMSTIGKSASKKNPTRRGMPELTPNMQRDDMISRIKESVWKSFESYHSRLPQDV